MRLESLVDTYCGYTHLDCEFETENTRRLYQTLNPDDQKVFNFDVTRINWPEVHPGDPHPGIETPCIERGGWGGFRGGRRSRRSAQLRIGVQGRPSVVSLPDRDENGCESEPGIGGLSASFTAGDLWIETRKSPCTSCCCGIRTDCVQHMIRAASELIEAVRPEGYFEGWTARGADVAVPRRGSDRP